jgi:ATP-binding cassette subfamily B protein
MKLTGKPLEAKKTIKRLFKYIAKDRLLLIIAIFLAIVGVVSSLLISYFLKPIIDNYIDMDKGKDLSIAERIDMLEKWLIFLSILSGVCFLGQYLSRRIMLSISQNSLKRMRNDLYAKLERLPISFFDKNKTGDIISRFTNDVDNIGEMLNTTLVEIITGVIQIVGTIFLLIYVNYILGLIVVLATPILMFLTKRIIKSGTQAFRGQSRALGTLDGYVSEMIEGEKVVKIFNYENESIDEFSYLNDNLKYYQTKAQFKSGLIGPITHQLCNVIYVIVNKFIEDFTFA